jgi:hypothetical protein
MTHPASPTDMQLQLTCPPQFPLGIIEDIVNRISSVKDFPVTKQPK